MTILPPGPREQETVSPAQFRILVVDDHPLMRVALREITRLEKDLTVCGEAVDAATARQLLAETQPHLVILDLSLGNDFGLDLIKELIASDSSWRILVLSIHDESFYAERALRAGALGYINKRESAECILKAIRTVLADKIYLPPEISDHLLLQFSGTKLKLRPDQVDVGQLTNRELQTFELVGQGVGSRDIAKRLGLSMKTIEEYRERIKRKLNLSGSAELIRRAVEWVISNQ